MISKQFILGREIQISRIRQENNIMFLKRDGLANLKDRIENDNTTTKIVLLRCDLLQALNCGVNSIL